MRDVIKLIEEEAGRNPAFAERLAEITDGLPAKKDKSGTKPKVLAQLKPLPDIIAAYQEKGDQEFRFWLREFDIPVLKAIVKANGFDPAKNSKRWDESDKFIVLIAEQTAARLRRGFAFLPSKATKMPET